MSSLLGDASIQKQSIPVLLEGRDALVCSQTGSGQSRLTALPGGPRTMWRALWVGAWQWWLFLPVQRKEAVLVFD